MRRAAFRSLIPITLVLLVIGLAWFAIRTAAELQASPTLLGHDVAYYLDRTSSWLRGDGFYEPFQLSGPYVVEQGGALYPPLAIALFVPFALGVPLVLWWAIPLGVLAAALVRLRPLRWTWPLMAAVLIYPRTWVVLVLGNPSMWVISAGVAGIAWGWPAVAAAVKPVFIPLMAVGMRRRSWWVGLGVTAVVAALFGSMWVSYAAALANARTTRGTEYLLGEWPIALVLLVGAWSGRARRQVREPVPQPVLDPTGVAPES